MFRILDIFCGAGGSCAGFLQVGNCEVTGVDIEPQTDYPGEFQQGDALALKGGYLREFDFIWASPPCQAYSQTTPCKFRHPDLVAEVRARLIASGMPWVIENVPSAPIRRDLFLCGEMFSLRVVRHRIFELRGFTARQPRHPAHKGACLHEYLKGNAPNWYYYSPHGHAAKWRECAQAMDVTHITTCHGVVEAIPPAYSAYILREYMRGQNQIEFDF